MIITNPEEIFHREKDKSEYWSTRVEENVEQQLDITLQEGRVYSREYSMWLENQLTIILTKKAVEDGKCMSEYTVDRCVYCVDTCKASRNRISKPTKEVLEQVLQERKRQNELFGEQNNTPIEWIAILSEEVGEASQQAVDWHFRYPKKQKTLTHTFREPVTGADQKQRLLSLREELIQVAAVAVSIVESLDRNELNEEERQDVYARTECVFKYCPNPKACSQNDKCNHSKIQSNE